MRRDLSFLPWRKIAREYGRGESLQALAEKYGVGVRGGDEVHKERGGEAVTTFFDLFAGVGGFRLGLERAGWRCVGWCEIDKWCQRVYRHRFPDGGWFWPDATTLDPPAMPGFDFLVAGVPCQAWSVAGKRRGFEDARGTLWFDCFRILEERKPRGFLFENVKGLVCRPFRDREFRRILEILRGMGYIVFWKVLNSKDFGVPQNRERVFIVGFRWDGPAPADFPWPEPRPLAARLADVLEREVPERYYVSGRALERIRGRMGRGPPARLRVGGGVATAVDADCWKGPGSHGQRTLVRVASVYESNADAGRVYSAEGVACTLKGEGGGLGAKTGLYTVYGNPSGTRTPHPNVPEVGEAERVYDPSGVSPPVKESSVNVLPPAVDCDGYLGELGHHGSLATCRIRRLTPVECERLQGFPDQFTRWGVDEEGNVVEVPDTHRYRMMGNAVTVTVAEALGRSINAYMRVLGWA
jgi:DNA (cytosine-5)-methyltransferase 1